MKYNILGFLLINKYYKNPKNNNYISNYNIFIKYYNHKMNTTLTLYR